MFRHKLVTLILVSTAVGHSLAARAAEPTQIAEGERLYNQNCVFCHQPDAIGKPGFAPSLTNPELEAAVAAPAAVNRTTALAQCPYCGVGCGTIIRLRTARSFPCGRTRITRRISDCSASRGLPPPSPSTWIAWRAIAMCAKTCGRNGANPDMAIWPM